MAKLAGVPDRVIAKAKEYLRELEAGRGSPTASEPSREAEQISLADVGGESVARRIRSLNLDGMTPFEALGLLYELKKEAGE